MWYKLQGVANPRTTRVLPANERSQFLWNADPFDASGVPEVCRSGCPHPKSRQQKLTDPYTHRLDTDQPFLTHNESDADHPLFGSS